jgi:hypothetical protein
MNNRFSMIIKMLTERYTAFCHCLLACPARRRPHPHTAPVANDTHQAQATSVPHSMNHPL